MCSQTVENKVENVFFKGFNKAALGRLKTRFKTYFFKGFNKRFQNVLSDASKHPSKRVVRRLKTRFNCFYKGLNKRLQTCSQTLENKLQNVFFKGFNKHLQNVLLYASNHASKRFFEAPPKRAVGRLKTRLKTFFTRVEQTGSPTLGNTLPDVFFKTPSQMLENTLQNDFFKSFNKRLQNVL